MSDSASHSSTRARRPHWVPLLVQAVLAGGVLWNAYELRSLGERTAAPPSWPREALEVQLKAGAPVTQCSVDLGPLAAKVGELAAAHKQAEPGSADPVLSEFKSGINNLITALTTLFQKLPQAERLIVLESSVTATQTALCPLLERIPITAKNGMVVSVPTFCSKK